VGSVRADTLRAAVRRALQLGTTREIEEYLEREAGETPPGQPLVGRGSSSENRSRS
jgi:hypothetical protein